MPASPEPFGAGHCRTTRAFGVFKAGRLWSDSYADARPLGRLLVSAMYLLWGSILRAVVLIMDRLPSDLPKISRVIVTNSPEHTWHLSISPWVSPRDGRVQNDQGEIAA